jgi:hypothetical protein
LEFSLSYIRAGVPGFSPFGPADDCVVFDRITPFGTKPNLLRAGNVHAHFDEFDRFRTASIVLERELQGRRGSRDNTGELVLIGSDFAQVIEGPEAYWGGKGGSASSASFCVRRGRPPGHFGCLPLDAFPTGVFRSHLAAQILWLKEVEQAEHGCFGFRFRDLSLPARRQNKTKEEAANDENFIPGFHGRFRRGGGSPTPQKSRTDRLAANFTKWLMFVVYVTSVSRRDKTLCGQLVPVNRQDFPGSRFLAVNSASGWETCLLPRCATFCDCDTRAAHLVTAAFPA